MQSVYNCCRISQCKDVFTTRPDTISVKLMMLLVSLLSTKMDISDNFKAYVADVVERHFSKIVLPQIAPQQSGITSTYQ